MRNCLILGSGRSGSSMVAGALAAAGYFAGDDLLRPNVGNPDGYFESRRVNHINHRLMMAMAPMREWGRFSTAHKRRRELDRLWIADFPVPSGPPLAARIVASRLREEMRGMLAREPWCLKDPRFSYTLPLWRPLIGDAVVVVTFREPERTARSMVRYFADVHRETIFFDEAMRGWVSAYEHVLAHAARGGDWVFVHCDDFAAGPGAEAVGRALGARLEPSGLRGPGGDSSRDLTGDVPETARRLFDGLLRAARRTEAAVDVRG